MAPPHPLFDRLRERARRIAARFPTPDFYAVHAPAHRQSADFLREDPVVSEMRQYVSERMDDNFGHGINHAVQVTLDAGALVLIESRALGCSRRRALTLLRTIQTAGLLHDIKRTQSDHAVKGARFAARVLKAPAFSPAMVGDICHAIRSHEAFTKPRAAADPERRLIAGCLYDADKFRWGPDNFKHTIWDMVAFAGIPFEEFVARYPKGMQGLERIKGTFRTPTGKTFGPQFLEMGIDIGRELFDVIQREFSAYL